MTTSTAQPHPRSKRRAAIAAWERDCVARLKLLEDVPRGREEAMDHRRQLESLTRTQELVQRLVRERHPDAARPSAVIVHRDEWMRGRLAGLLTSAGVTVVGTAADGAEGLAYAVFEQPELVVLEDRLPWVTSLELVRAVRLFAPDAHLVVQSEDSLLGDACVEAGADAAYGRRVPLTELRDLCLNLLEAA